MREPAATSDRREGSVRSIDFALPAKFTREHVRRLRHAHEAFCRTAGMTLSMLLRCPVQLEWSSHAQAAHTRLLGELSPTALPVELELDGTPKRIVLVVDLTLAAELVDRLFGAGDRPRPTAPEALTELELGVLERAIISRMVDALAMAWEDLAGAQLQARQLKTSPMALETTASTEATLSVAFAVSIGDRAHTLTLLLPWEDVGDLLAAREQALPRADRRSRAAMAGALAGASVELRAEVGSRALTLDEIARLRPGDVLRLERRAEQGITLLVGDTTLYHGEPGRHGRRRAIRIVERVPTGTAASDASVSATRTT